MCLIWLSQSKGRAHHQESFLWFAGVQPEIKSFIQHVWWKLLFPFPGHNAVLAEAFYRPSNLCQFLKNEQIGTPMSHRSWLAAFKSPSTAARELRLNGMKSKDLWPLQHLWFMVHRHRKSLFSIPPFIKLFHWLLVKFCLGNAQNKHLNLQQHIE